METLVWTTSWTVRNSMLICWSLLADPPDRWGFHFPDGFKLRIVFVTLESAIAAINVGISRGIPAPSSHHVWNIRNDKELFTPLLSIITSHTLIDSYKAVNLSHFVSSNLKQWFIQQAPAKKLSHFLASQLAVKN